jgi:DnaJ-class molecular chaperone
MPDFKIDQGEFDADMARSDEEDAEESIQGCTECGGVGYHMWLSAEDSEICEHCHGTGVEPEKDLVETDDVDKKEED